MARPNDLYDQAGRASSRGVELSAEFAHELGFRLRAAYAYTRARYDEYSYEDERYAGNRPAFVPDHSFTFWGTYRHASGFGLGLGGRALGVSYADTANVVPLPAYAVLDTALYYRWSIVELALNVNNVFDNGTYLVGAINDSQVYPGAPRGRWYRYGSSTDFKAEETTARLHDIDMQYHVC